MPNPFDTVRAHALNEEQRDVVKSIFGEPAVLPPDSTVAFDGKHLVIEHCNLDEFVERYDKLHPALCAEGKLFFPIDVSIEL